MKTIIVDDSEIERLNLRILLNKNPMIDIVGEAHDLTSAIELIQINNCDLLFLDIHLGHEKGFDLLSSFEKLPHIILTTSHPQYALKGFEVNAADYILKPVTEEKLARALDRLPPLPANSQETKLTNESKLFLKNAAEYNIHSVSEIALVKADRPYTQIIVSSGANYLHNRTIKQWQEVLPETEFMSIDRSTILNISMLAKLTTDQTNNYHLHFKDPEIAPLTISNNIFKKLKTTFDL
ncbi:MAG: LytR/AlgR family response regulator transcription factor [Akkermansiaceae bacterium]